MCSFRGSFGEFFLAADVFVMVTNFVTILHRKLNVAQRHGCRLK